MDSLTFISELAKTLASLAWPICVVVSVFLFRGPILDLIPAVKQLKLFGMELLFERVERKLENASASEIQRIQVAVQPNELPTEDVGQEESLKIGRQEANRELLKSVMTEGLSPLEKAVIIFYYFEEMSFTDIAATFDMPVKDVAAIHSRVIGLLREKMADRKRQLQSSRENGANARP